MLAILSYIGQDFSGTIRLSNITGLIQTIGSVSNEFGYVYAALPIYSCMAIRNPGIYVLILYQSLKPYAS